MKPIIKSKGFVLRHLRMSDAKGYFECQTDAQARKMFMATPKSLADAKKELKQDLAKMNKKKPSHEFFAIEINGEFAGFIWISEISYGYSKHKASLGYCLHKHFRGRGIGTVAIKSITDYAFKKYKLKRMATFTRTFNKASARALQKAGYKLEGILRKNKFKNGKYLDDMLWAKVR
jgi:ribosomal-protein-alanine N-acetyltransferase